MTEPDSVLGHEPAQEAIISDNVDQDQHIQNQTADSQAQHEDENSSTHCSNKNEAITHESGVLAFDNSATAADQQSDLPAIENGGTSQTCNSETTVVQSPEEHQDSHEAATSPSEQRPLDALDEAIAGGDSEDSEDNQSESDSSDSSEDSSDSDDDKAQDRLGEDSDEEMSSGPIKSKNELINPPAPTVPSNFSLTSDMAIEPIGELVSLVENTAIVKASVSGEFRILNEESILCFEDRQLLGVLYETFGRVESPMYTVKFDTAEELKTLASKLHQKVFYVVPASSFLYTEQVRQVKGSDASNLHDEEIPEEEQEFSDDEKEMQSKASAKKRKRSHKPKQQNSLKIAGSSSQSGYSNPPPTQAHQQPLNHPQYRGNASMLGHPMMGNPINYQQQPQATWMPQPPSMPFMPFGYPAMQWLPPQYSPSQFTYNNGSNNQGLSGGAVSGPPQPQMPSYPPPPQSQNPPAYGGLQYDEN